MFKVSYLPRPVKYSMPQCSKCPTFLVAMTAPRQEDICGGLVGKPSRYVRIGFGAHQLRDNVGVEQDYPRTLTELGWLAHWLARRYVQFHTTQGRESSAYGACQIGGGAGSVSAARKIARASSSIEWPCSAAWMHRRCFMSSSRLRIVMLAMLSTSNSGKMCNDVIGINDIKRPRPLHYSRTSIGGLSVSTLR